MASQANAVARPPPPPTKSAPLAPTQSAAASSVAAAKTAAPHPQRNLSGPSASPAMPTAAEDDSFVDMTAVKDKDYGVHKRLQTLVRAGIGRLWATPDRIRSVDDAVRQWTTLQMIAEDRADAEAHARHATEQHTSLSSEHQSAACEQLLLRFSKLARMFEVLKHTTLVLDSSAAIDLMSDETCRMLECDRAIVHLVDRERAQVNVRPHTLRHSQLALKCVATKSAAAQRALVSATGLSFPIGQGLAGSVAQDGIMLHATDVCDPVLFDPEVDFVFHESTTRNVLSVPVFDRQGLIIAVLSACNKSADGGGVGGGGGVDFSTDDELLLEALSLQFGLMLSNCLTYEHEMAERRKADALAQLNAIIDSFDASSSAQLFPMCHRVAELGRTLLHCDKSNIFIVDYLRSELFQASAIDDGQDLIIVPLESGIAGHVARTGVGTNVADCYQDSRFFAHMDASTGFRSKSVLAHPLTDTDASADDSIATGDDRQSAARRGRVLAVMQFLNKTGGGVFTREDEDLAIVLAARTTAALKRHAAAEAERLNRARHESSLRIIQRVNAMHASSASDASELVLDIISVAKRLLEVDIVSLFLISDDRATLSKFNVQAGESISFPSSTGIAGFVVRSGETVNIPDCYKDARFNNFMDRKTGYHTQSMLCVPIFGADRQTLGVIQLINKASAVARYAKQHRSVSYGVFTAHDEETLAALTSQIALALAQAELQRRAAAVRRQNDAMLTISRDVLAQAPLDELITTMMSAAKDLLAVDIATLFLVDRGSRQLWKLNVAAGQEPIRIPINTGLAGFVATSGQSINIPDVYEDARFNQAIDKRTGYRTRSMLCVPVLDKSQHVIAVAQMINKAKGGVFSAADEVLLHALSQQISVAIISSSLYSEVRNVRAAFGGLSLAVPHLVLSLSAAGRVTALNHKEQTRHPGPADQVSWAGPSNSSGNLSSLTSTAAVLAPLPPSLCTMLGGVTCNVGTHKLADLWSQELNARLLSDVQTCMETGHAIQVCDFTLRRPCSQRSGLSSAQAWQALVDLGEASPSSIDPKTPPPFDILAIVNYCVAPQNSEDLSQGCFLTIEDASQRRRERIELLRARESEIALRDSIAKLTLANECALPRLAGTIEEPDDALHLKLQNLQLHVRNDSSLNRDKQAALLEAIDKVLDDSVSALDDENRVDSFLAGEFSPVGSVAAAKTGAAEMARRQSLTGGRASALLRQTSTHSTANARRSIARSHAAPVASPAPATSASFAVKVVPPPPPASKSPGFAPMSSSALAVVPETDVSAAPEQSAASRVSSHLSPHPPPTLRPKSLSAISSKVAAMPLSPFSPASLAINLIPHPTSTGDSSSDPHSREHSGVKAPTLLCATVLNFNGHSAASMNVWDLDTLGMTNLGRARMVVDAFRHFDLLNTFQIPVERVVSYVCALSREYLPNPFHNFVHGFTVFHAAFFTLANSSARAVLTPLDHLSMLVAALCHDVGHRGRTNAFEINTNSELSLLYNDKSVLENYHAQLAFAIMQVEQNDIFCNLTRVQHRQVRSAIISMILNTDMAYHFDLLNKFKARVAGDRLKTEPFSIDSMPDRQLLADLLVHSCDLSAPAKPFSIAQTWTLLCDQEFSAQVAEEAELELPISTHLVANDSRSLGKRETGFIDFIIEPLWKLVATALPELEPCYAHIAANRREWQRVQDGAVSVERPYVQTAQPPAPMIPPPRTLGGGSS